MGSPVRENTEQITLAVDHSANIRVIRYLQKRNNPRVPLSLAPQQIDDPYYQLGTHPDLVEHLWDDLTRYLPSDCRWVVCGAPALVHPQSGIVFGFVGGTGTCALRLPEQERQEALHAGAQRVIEYPRWRE